MYFLFESNISALKEQSSSHETYPFKRSFLPHLEAVEEV